MDDPLDLHLQARSVWVASDRVDQGRRWRGLVTASDLDGAVSTDSAGGARGARGM
ncbi:hypothetical protein [Propionibacterium sp. oral taxon 192]|uniref:hypothetical protein n=1 Tax=Propionibacterium sp. oral taxon 192 TaxID=671222 RepID=UPI0003A202FF|nr:hypothetical protein [Propionibacterium sp. oral taxon 192]